MDVQAALQAFTAARAADLQVVQAYAGSLLQHKALVTPTEAQQAALLSTLLLLAAINAALLLLVPRGRKLVFDTAETVLAIGLIIVLLAVVLGLPLGEPPPPPPPLAARLVTASASGWLPASNGRACPHAAC